MGSYFFSGSHTAKIDEKNRIVIPHEMRYGLCEEGEMKFTLGLGLGGSLAIYKNKRIAKIVEKFQEKEHVAKYQPFFTLFFSTLFPTTCDQLGRVLIPQPLKEAAQIQKEVVIAGVLQKIEIWPKEVYDKKLQGLLHGKMGELQKMMEDAFQLLEVAPEEEEKKVRLEEGLLQTMQSLKPK